MSGELDIEILLKNLEPVLHDFVYVFCSLSRKAYERLPIEPLGLFFETEGVSLIIREEQANASELPYESVWACITLNVHSSLTAVGFLAAIASELAQAGISVNPVSAYYHDHLFVPWDRKADAMEALRELSGKT